MTDKQKGIVAIIVSIVLLAIGVTLTLIAYNTKLISNFAYVKKLGAVDSTIFPGSVEFNGYRFFTNNRFVRLSDGQKGNYDKTQLTFDNGTTIELKTIFK